MDQEEEVLEEEIVEEVLEDGEIFDEMMVEEGEGLYEEMEEVNVDEVEYEQIQDGASYQYVVQSTPIQHMPVSTIHPQRMQAGGSRLGPPTYLQPQAQPERPAQSQHVYAIRGNQVYRVDKVTGIASAVRSLPIPKSENVPLYMRQPEYVKEVRQLPQQRTSYYQAGVSSKPAPSQSSSLPLAYRASEASFQHNRLLTPFLAARIAQKNRRQGGLGSRKPCNCTKSMCLKLYCDCFANGEFCKDCNCKDCHNNMENEAERSRAIKLSLERNPNAFKPKIGVAPRGRVDVERLHQKGCHCKKSNCLKNYCECYEAKVPCTDRCKCCSCRNTENDRATKFRTKFNPAGDFRQLSGSATAEPRTSSPFTDEESEPDTPEPSDPKTLPWFYMTDEVVEAATLCLVAQAEEVESKGSAEDEQLELAILKEFGRCLGQVIDNATYNAQAAKAASKST